MGRPVLCFTRSNSYTNRAIIRIKNLSLTHSEGEENDRSQEIQEQVLIPIPNSFG